mgnify:CR=1 FL=1
MALAFFGLRAEDKEVFLEHTFLLMYYGGFTYVECYNMPIWQRVWFIKRINDEIKKSQGQSHAAHHNDPQQRAMMNRQRANVPSKLRRFT